ncbi:hypothetical protein Tco_1137182, partial [Tanacetum coccineum]
MKNLMFHSKTKHIEIRHHFIRDSYEKRLIQVIKIHTDHNVDDLLTKAFDVSSNEFGVKTGSCKVNTARQDLVLLGRNNTAEGVSSKYNGFFAVDFLTTSSINYALTVSPTIYASYIEQFWATAKSKTVNDVKQIHATVDGKTVVISESSMRSDLHFNDEDVTIVATQHQKTHKPRRAKRSQDTKIPQSSGPPKKVSDEAFYIREDDIVVRAATTASSLKTEQESCSGPRHQDTTLGGADAQTRFKTASKKSHDPPLSEGNTSGSRENNMEYQGTLNSDSINVSTAGPSNVSDTGPSTSTAGDIFEDVMTPISDTLVAIRSARQRTISVMICNVEEEPRRATLVPIVQSQDK